MATKTATVPLIDVPPLNIRDAVPGYNVRLRVTSEQKDLVSQWTQIYRVSAPAYEQFEAGELMPMDISLVNGILSWEGNTFVCNVDPDSYPGDSPGTRWIETDNSLRAGDGIRIQALKKFSPKGDGLFEIVAATAERFAIFAQIDDLDYGTFIAESVVPCNEVDVYCRFVHQDPTLTVKWTNLGRHTTKASTTIPIRPPARGPKVATWKINKTLIAIQRPTVPAIRYTTNNMFNETSGAILADKPLCPVTICGRVFDTQWLF